MAGAASVPFVDVYVLRFASGGLEALVLRRGPRVRCTGAWETVHGSIEGDETAVAAALRELREETGFAPDRFYNLSRTESFYLHRTNEVVLIPVFAAIVPPGRDPALSEEHDAFEWLSLDAAALRFAWPRERRGIVDAGQLLAGGDAGPLEAVLRILPPV